MRKLALISIILMLSGLAAAFPQIQNYEVSPETAEPGEEVEITVEANFDKFESPRVTLEWSQEPNSWDTDAITKHCENIRPCEVSWTGDDAVVFDSEGNYDFNIAARQGLNADYRSGELAVEETGTTNEPPTADFSVDKDGLTVDVDASGSSDSDGSIEEYEWKWRESGDFETGNEQDSHTYNNGGEYEITLRVTDDDGSTDTYSQTVTVEETAENEPPTADFSYSPSSPEVDETVTFDAGSSSDPDGTIESYAWDLNDDGEFNDGSDRLATESFSSEGSYDVSLRVTDDDGETGTATKTVTVSEETTGGGGDGGTDDGPSPVCEVVPGFLELDREVLRKGQSTTASIVVFNQGDSQRVKTIFRTDYGERKTVEKTIPGSSRRAFSTEFSPEEDSEISVQVKTFDGGPCGDSDLGIQTQDVDVFDRSADTATLKVIVEDEDGDRIRNARIDVENGDSETEFTDSDGENSFALDPDTYHVTVSKDGFDTETERVTLVSGEDETMTFVLEGGDVADPGDGEDDEDQEDATLNVNVTDESDNPLEDVDVEVRNGDTEGDETDEDGLTSFELEPGDYDVIVTKDGYRPETEDVELDSGEEENLHFQLEELEDDEASLEVDVEDEDGDAIEDAEVEVENGDDETEDTNSVGRAFFTLDPDDYDVTVSKDDYETESQEIELEAGDDERLDFVLEREDDDDGFDDGDDKDVEIEQVSHSDTACRGEDFVVRVQVSNSGDRLERITVTGSGLGSTISTGSSTLEEGETETRQIVFEDVEGSGTEAFGITVTNHNSDSASQTVNVENCDDFGEREVDGMSMELSPNRVHAGETVKVSGFVDGTRGRENVEISVSGFQEAEISTEPDGYYQAFIHPKTVGELAVTARSGDKRQSRKLTVLPTTNVAYANSPDKVFEGEKFEVCAKVNSQITPLVSLKKDGEIVESRNDKGEVCFERTASGVDEHTYTITSVVRGGSRSAASTKTEVLEADSEVKSFPEKIASVESEDGIVKATIYNNNHERKTYDIQFYGLPDHWDAQTDREVILQPGERREVFFYITPENEGVFNTEMKITSQGQTVYRSQVRVYSGGTKTKPVKSSWLDRLFERFSL